MITFDEFKSIETNWIALYVNGNNKGRSYDAIYFNSFKVEHIPKEIQKIYRKQKCNNKCIIQ